MVPFSLILCFSLRQKCNIIFKNYTYVHQPNIIILRGGVCQRDSTVGRMLALYTAKPSFNPWHSIPGVTPGVISEHQARSQP